MEQENYTEQFIEEADKVKYVRTENLPPYGEVKVEVYLTKAYLDSTDNRVIVNYLNNAVADILTRNGVTR